MTSARFPFGLDEDFVRDRSNEIDDLSKILASGRTSAGTRVASSTATRISTIGPSQLGSLIADRVIEVGWNVFQPALLRVDPWRFGGSDPPALDCAGGCGAGRSQHSRDAAKGQIALSRCAKLHIPRRS